ncbi:hypothetical protein CYMTET_52592 [Cymbomonas tetramitiformis]|uniref:Sulfotransferase n=1 Tax=Cymbomonas tetramitiformis TaxID=36881 RepID=A0AAE0BIQ4_9CHLO|nr:hypothetical protein CYMTET_52592 [Cymbomonas tetramitiformis]
MRILQESQGRIPISSRIGGSRLHLKPYFEDIKHVPSSKRMLVMYEDFVRDPESTFERITDLLQLPRFQPTARVDKGTNNKYVTQYQALLDKPSNLEEHTQMLRLFEPRLQSINIALKTAYSFHDFER